VDLALALVLGLAILAMAVAALALLTAREADHKVRRLEARIRNNEIASLLGDVPLTPTLPSSTVRAARTALPDPPEIEGDWRAAVEERARSGRVVEAVLIYRKHTGASLPEAVAEVRRIAGREG
jgi:hypothetical protein